MKQYVIIGAILVGCMAGSLQAREFRAPHVTNPKGYDFDIPDAQGVRFELTGTSFVRESHRAFTASHSTATEPLSGLVFNSDEFRLSHAFRNAQVPLNTKNYNPFMRIMKVRPRVTYTEHGVNLSASVSKEIIRDKATIGVRARVPFKTVQWKRKDAGGRRDQQTEDVMSIDATKGGDNTNGFAYRLDFLEAMPDTKRDSQVDYTASTGSGSSLVKTITFFGGGSNDSSSPKAAFLYTNEGHPPRGTSVGTLENPTTLLSETLSGSPSETQYKTDGVTDYSGLTDVDALSVSDRVALQDKKAQVWVSSILSGSGYVAGATSAISTNMKNYLSMFNANSYEWLHDHGYDFDSDASRQVGVGDIDLDVFYEHMLSDRIIFEVSAGARIPTAPGKDYASTPYAAHIGNGEHAEVHVGAKAQLEARHWLAVVLSGSYNVALSSTERTCATPEGSLVKNLGKAVDADVKWSYGVGNFELHFCHPRTTDLTGVLGYQLYYKGSDTVTFKEKSTESWLGKKYNSTGGEYTTAYDVTLDGALAAARTQQVGHRLIASMTYQFSDYFSMSAGGAWTIAGKNMPKENDLFASVAVVF